MPRLRFSLLTALLVTTIIALVIVIVQFWREVGPLREEVYRLRDQYNILSIKDPKKVHAIRVSIHSGDLVSSGRLAWIWRVWIPENEVYIVRCFGEYVPGEHFPTGGISARIGAPGEHIILYSIAKDVQSDEWIGRLTVDSADSIPSGPHSWAASRPIAIVPTSGEVGTKTCSFELGERVDLARFRISQAVEVGSLDHPGPGLMIWMESAQ